MHKYYFKTVTNIKYSIISVKKIEEIIHLLKIPALYLQVGVIIF